MLTEVMKHYGLASDLHAAGYYETDHHRQLCREVHAAILGGRLVAIAGMVGCGKTALPQHLQADLYQRPGPMTHFILRRHDRFLPAGMRARTGPPEPRGFAFIGVHWRFLSFGRTNNHAASRSERRPARQGWLRVPEWGTANERQ